VSTITADAVVVGSGVVGSAIALELARIGCSTVVADRAHAPGCGSTSASSAVLRFDYSTQDGVALAWESSHCWAAWPDHLNSTGNYPLAHYRRTGAIALDVPVAAKERTHELYKNVGVEAEEWTADDLRRNVPGMNPARFWPPKAVDDPEFWAEPDSELGATYVADGGFIDDALLATQNLAAAARSLGVRFAFGSKVEKLITSHGRANGVVTATGDTINAPVVVNAAGPWSGQLNRIAGVGGDFNIRVRPLRVEVHQVPAPPGYSVGSRLGPVVGDLDLGIYLRAAPGDVLLIGGTEPACDELDWADDPDAVNQRCTRTLHNRQVLRASRRFPGLTIPNSPKGVVGVYDVAEDWIPIYDKTELPGYYIAIGTSGNQFKNAPVVGQIMAALIGAEEGGHDHDVEPLLFSCAHTGNHIDVSAFSRRREPNKHSTGTVLG
jgi:sarcosine oxidase subunit beta